MCVHELAKASSLESKWEMVGYDFSELINNSATVLLITPQYEMVDRVRKSLESEPWWCAVDAISGTRDIVARLISRKYGLLLIDLNTPGVVETVSRIREAETPEFKIPIVGLSGADRQPCVDADIQRIVLSSMRSDVLARVVMHYVFSVDNFDDDDDSPLYAGSSA